MLGGLLRTSFIQMLGAMALLAGPAAVSAHGGASPSLVVTVDHVDPGATVPIIAADFGSDSKVLFSIEAPARSLELGRWTAGADGHFSASFALPADFPLGWANVVATGDDGSSTSTQVLVGPTAGAPPRPGRATPWWQDPSAWLLGAFLAGAFLVMVWFVFRRQPARQAARRR